MSLTVHKDGRDTGCTSGRCTCANGLHMGGNIENDTGAENVTENDLQIFCRDILGLLTFTKFQAIHSTFAPVAVTDAQCETYRVERTDERTSPQVLARLRDRKLSQGDRSLLHLVIDCCVDFLRRGQSRSNVRRFWRHRVLRAACAARRTRTLGRAGRPHRLRARERNSLPAAQMLDVARLAEPARLLPVAFLGVV